MDVEPEMVEEKLIEERRQRRNEILQKYKNKNTEILTLKLDKNVHSGSIPDNTGIKSAMTGTVSFLFALLQVVTHSKISIGFDFPRRSIG